MEAIAVSNDVRQQLIENQLRQWRERMEDYRIAFVVAETIDDEKMKEGAKAEMTKCVKAIEKLESMLKELEGTNEKAN